MTQRLEQAMRKISTLPTKEQDAFARFIMAELESERRWDALFASSQDLLSKMAGHLVGPDHR